MALFLCLFNLIVSMSANVMEQNKETGVPRRLIRHMFTSMGLINWYEIISIIYWNDNFVLLQQNHYC